MAEHSRIEWTDATWNPITGCSVVSPGCTNCYAMRLAGTRLRHHPSRAGLTRDGKAGPVWTGTVRFNAAWLDQPLRWRAPRRIFVCAHGDLFHESVPDEWIDRVFAVMALAPRHTFQVLTKRSARMRAWVQDRAIDGMLGAVEHRARRIARDRGSAVPAGKTLAGTWPWPHVWLGVSAEDQRRADERVPDLLAMPAAARFVSAEPLLGQIDLRGLLHHCPAHDFAGGFCVQDCGHWRRLSWVIAGGESGPGARPCHPAWARALRDQCATAGVPFFWKQWGEYRSSIAGLALAPDGSSPGPDRWDASTGLDGAGRQEGRRPAARRPRAQRHAGGAGMTEELKRHLDEAVTLINFAHALLRPALPMLERFEREAQRFASIGAIVDPSLYRRALSEPWREDAREAFAAATTFVRTMNGIAERFAARASEGGEEP